MRLKFESLIAAKQSLTLIFCAGFEERVTRAPELLAKVGLRVKQVATFTYLGNENEANLDKLREIAREIGAEKTPCEINAQSIAAVRDFVAGLSGDRDIVAVDITGFSRLALIELLSAIYDAKIGTYLLYTEASEYFPTKADFDSVAKGRASHDALLMLSQFENQETMYSSHCALEEIVSLPGEMLPNYPLMLISFLTFKRGRVSVILQAYEANRRILVRGVPVRKDLKWRAQAIDIPNRDLMDDSLIVNLETLDWQKTYKFLSELYEQNYNRYRYNFLVAPLGSKMQTVGAWLFAKERPSVRMISSTPKKLFPEKYSKGQGQTFLFDDLPEPINPRARLESLAERKYRRSG